MKAIFSMTIPFKRLRSKKCIQYCTGNRPEKKFLPGLSPTISQWKAPHPHTPGNAGRARDYKGDREGIPHIYPIP